MKQYRSPKKCSRPRASNCDLFFAFAADRAFSAAGSAMYIKPRRLSGVPQSRASSPHLRARASFRCARARPRVASHSPRTARHLTLPTTTPCAFAQSHAHAPTHPITNRHHNQISGQIPGPKPMFLTASKKPAVTIRSATTENRHDTAIAPGSPPLAETSATPAQNHIRRRGHPGTPAQKRTTPPSAPSPQIPAPSASTDL